MREMPIDQPRQVGLYVRQVREARGMTRAALAKEAGVSERLLASLELGDATGIRLDKLLAVLRVLGISLLALLPGADGTGLGASGKTTLRRHGPELRGQPAGQESGRGEGGAKAPATYDDAYRSFMACQGMRAEAVDDARHGEGAGDGES